MICAATRFVDRARRAASGVYIASVSESELNSHLSDQRICQARRDITRSFCRSRLDHVCPRPNTRDIHTVIAARELACAS